MLKFAVFILFLGTASLASSPLCPLPVPAKVPFYDDLYGSSSSEVIGVVNARILSEESNLRSALAELQIQHSRVARIWPARGLSHVIRLEDAPSILVSGRQAASRRTLSMFFTGPDLTCVQLELSLIHI